jgi:hypothetical protein
MIKTLVAYTLEVDDEDTAVSEILEQLDLEQKLCKNSVGIISCHEEFILAGIVKTLCGKLPFDTVGINTMNTAVPQAAEQMILALMVLTSDEVSFSAGLSGSLNKEHKEPFQEVFDKTAAALPEKPSLIMSFAPLLFNLAGDKIVELMDLVSGGLPNFGTIAIDFTTQIRNPKVIFKGETYQDRLAIILFSGKFEPHFSVISLAENRVLQQKAVITKSQGNVLIEINNIPVVQYLKSLGLFMDESVETLNQIPLVVDFNDNVQPVARAILAMTPEGYFVCGGGVPEGCTVTVGSINKDDVLTTAAATTRAMMNDNQDGLLMYSCVARNFALGLDTMAELKVIRETLGQDMSYMFSYSGGEICPVKNNTGELKNRFHNETLISCSFK